MIFIGFSPHRAEALPYPEIRFKKQDEALRLVNEYIDEKKHHR